MTQIVIVPDPMSPPGFKVNRNPAVIHIGDHVEWKCTLGDEYVWTVHLPDLTPFLKSSFHGAGMDSTDGDEVIPGQLGRYKYTVAVFDGEEIQVLDPDLWLQ